MLTMSWTITSSAWARFTWIGATRSWGERISVAAFIQATFRMAQGVLDEHPGAGYGGLWEGRPFPLEELALLKRGLG